jgi:hypothetical protein
VVAGVFTGTGSLDLAVSNSASGNVSLLLNRNDGGRAAPGRQSRTIERSPISPANVAALAALFATAHPVPVSGIVLGQQSATGAGAASRPETVLEQQTRDDASILPVHHRRSRTDTGDAAELTDLMAGDLGLLEG